MGKLFVIDGTDGSGKQTQSTLLQQWNILCRVFWKIR